MAPWRRIFTNRFDSSRTVSLGKMLLLSWPVATKYQTLRLLHITPFPQQVCIDSQNTTVELVLRSSASMWALALKLLSESWSCCHQQQCWYSPWSWSCCHQPPYWHAPLSWFWSFRHGVNLLSSATMLTLAHCRVGLIAISHHVDTRSLSSWSYCHQPPCWHSLTVELVLLPSATVLTFAMKTVFYHYIIKLFLPSTTALTQSSWSQSCFVSRRVCHFSISYCFHHSRGLVAVRYHGDTRCRFYLDLISPPQSWQSPSILSESPQPICWHHRRGIDLVAIKHSVDNDAEWFRLPSATVLALAIECWRPRCWHPSWSWSCFFFTHHLDIGRGVSLVCISDRDRSQSVSS